MYIQNSSRALTRSAAELPMRLPLIILSLITPARRLMTSIWIPWARIRFWQMSRTAFISRSWAPVIFRMSFPRQKSRYNTPGLQPLPVSMIFRRSRKTWSRRYGPLPMIWIPNTRISIFMAGMMLRPPHLIWMWD